MGEDLSQKIYHLSRKQHDNEIHQIIRTRTDLWAGTQIGRWHRILVTGKVSVCKASPWKEASPKPRRSWGSGHGHWKERNLTLATKWKELVFTRWGRWKRSVFDHMGEKTWSQVTSGVWILRDVWLKMTSRSEISSSNRNQGSEQRNTHVSLKKEGSCQSKLVLQIESSFFFFKF